MKEFRSKQELYSFVNDVAGKLRQVGEHSAAKMLSTANTVAYTSSSEWLGEIGLAVMEIRSQCRLDRDLEIDCDDIMSEVQRFWPDIERAK